MEFRMKRHFILMTILCLKKLGSVGEAVVYLFFLLLRPPILYLFLLCRKAESLIFSRVPKQNFNGSAELPKTIIIIRISALGYRTLNILGRRFAEWIHRVIRLLNQYESIKYLEVCL